MKKKGKMKFKDSLAEGWHHSFSTLEGSWKGSSKVWFEPGEPIDSAIVEGTFQSLLSHRFSQFSYSTTFQGEAISGVMTFGVFLKLNQFQLSWIDSFHTGTAIMHSTGSASNSLFNVYTTYPAGEENEQEWGWRTELEIKNPDHIIIRAFNRAPGETETLATEFDLQRC